MSFESQWNTHTAYVCIHSIFNMDMLMMNKCRSNGRWARVKRNAIQYGTTFIHELEHACKVQNELLALKWFFFSSWLACMLMLIGAAECWYLIWLCLFITHSHFSRKLFVFEAYNYKTSVEQLDSNQMWECIV